MTITLISVDELLNTIGWSR